MVLVAMKIWKFWNIIHVFYSGNLEVPPANEEVIYQLLDNRSHQPVSSKTLVNPKSGVKNNHQSDKYPPLYEPNLQEQRTGYTVDDDGDELKLYKFFRLLQNLTDSGMTRSCHDLMHFLHHEWLH